MIHKLLPLLLLLGACLGLHAQPGSIDATFNPGTGANNSVWAMVLQPDGKILIGGDFTSYNGTGRNHVARLNGGAGATSIHEPLLGAVAPQFFPNPTRGQLFLRLPELNAGPVLYATRIEFFDAAGRRVWSESFELAGGAERRLDLSRLPAGVYGWTLQVGDVGYYGRVVKE